MIEGHEEAKVQPASSRIAERLCHAIGMIAVNMRRATAIKLESMLLRLLSVLVAAVVLDAAAQQPPDVEGDWRNTRNTIHMRVARCGEAHCASVIWATAKAQRDARKGSDRDLVGSQLLTDLRRQRDGSWRGNAYVPDLDLRVSARVVQVDPNKLRVSGCMIAGLVCQTRHWHRLD